MKLGIRGLFVALGLVILSVLLLSCGGDDKYGASPPAPAAASPTSAPPGGGGGAATLSVTIATLAYRSGDRPAGPAGRRDRGASRAGTDLHGMTIQNGPS